MPALTNGACVNVTGYYSRNDGGGGVFVFDAYSVAADDSGTIISPNKGAGRWKRQSVGQPCSIRWFGAKGDNVADDKIAIQSTINFVSERGGGVVTVPASSYKSSGNIVLPANIILQGEGRRSSIISFTHSGDGLSSLFALNSSTAANIGIRDLAISCTNVANVGTGFINRGGSFVYLHNVYFSGWKYASVCDQGEICSFVECEFIVPAAGTAAIWLTNGPDYTAGASPMFTNRILISGCQFNSGSPTSIGVQDDGGSNHSVRDNNFNGGLMGARFCDCYGLVFDGNECEGAQGPDLVLDHTKAGGGYVGPCSGFKITGNTFVSGASGTNLRMNAGLNGQISGNTFAQAATAINFPNGANNPCAGNVIEGNALLVRGAARTGGNLLDGARGPLQAQTIRQAACTFVAQPAAAGVARIAPASMQGIEAGQKLNVINEDGSNFEQITVRATAGKAFEAVLASPKKANWIINGVAPLAP